MEKDPQVTFLSRADGGDPYDAPPLATCSYFDYDRKMGTATRISRGAPRAALSRWTDKPHWPTVRELFPGLAYFHKGLAPAAVRDFYRDDLDKLGPQAIAAALRAVPCDDTGQLVLLCFEKTADVLAEPWVCHRRVFAEWWTEKTGRDVPELTRLPGPGGRTQQHRDSRRGRGCDDPATASGPAETENLPLGHDTDRGTAPLATPGARGLSEVSSACGGACGEQRLRRAGTAGKRGAGRNRRPAPRPFVGGKPDVNQDGMSWNDRQAGMLRARFPGWDIWYVPVYQGPDSWCAKPAGHPVATVNRDSPGDLAAALAGEPAGLNVAWLRPGLPEIGAEDEATIP